MGQMASKESVSSVPPRVPATWTDRVGCERVAQNERILMRCAGNFNWNAQFLTGDERNRAHQSGSARTLEAPRAGLFIGADFNRRFQRSTFGVARPIRRSRRIQSARPQIPTACVETHAALHAQSSRRRGYGTRHFLESLRGPAPLSRGLDVLLLAASNCSQLSQERTQDARSECAQILGRCGSWRRYGRHIVEDEGLGFAGTPRDDGRDLRRCEQRH